LKQSPRLFIARSSTGDVSFEAAGHQRQNGTIRDSPPHRLRDEHKLTDKEFGTSKMADEPERGASSGPPDGVKAIISTLKHGWRRGRQYARADFPSTLGKVS
jgi:hypothetical protein